MGAWSELQERDRLMDTFILTDPLLITLTRPTKTSTAAGGVVVTATPQLAPQIFHIYPFKRRLTVEAKYNPQTFGEEKVEHIHWILIWNRPDTDIAVGDYFDPSTDTDPITDRLLPGIYEVDFISARLWDRGQAGVLFRGAG